MHDSDLCFTGQLVRVRDRASKNRAPQARALLTPTGVGSLTVTGRTVTLEHVEARAVQIDRDVTIPDTNRHPAYGVDLFRLVSIAS